MKNTRRLLVLTLIALLALFSVMPSTFSWFTHSDENSGDVMKYSREDFPLSVKSGSVSMTTKTFDKENKAVGNALGSNSIPSVSTNGEAYYQTEFKNNGTKDVYLNFGIKSVKNLAGIYIGSTSPIVNERTYTSRPSADFTKTSEKTRIYFETATSNEFGFQDTSFWQGGTASNKKTDEQMNSNSPGSSFFGTYDYDMNIGYYDGDTVKYACMNACNNTELRSGAYRTVYYYDIPASCSKIFFCSKWYFRTTSNQEQNRTRYIENPTPGTLYYLTGKEVDGKVKAYSTTTSVNVGGTAYNNSLINLAKRYTSVRMAIGQNVDLGLSKPEDYSASSIAYSIPKSGDSDYTGHTSTFETAPTIDRDGTFTAKSSGTGYVRTTLTSPLGDTMVYYTYIEVPDNITELPIMENIRVPGTSSADESNSVVVKWYLRNRSDVATATFGNIYFTF